MVDRYKPSLGVPVAPVARPRESGQAQIAEAVGGLANQALGIAQKKLEERTASLEAASLNSARIELEKRGGEMALELQKDRIAGTDYVKDLEKARAALKDEVWGKLPGRVQNSARARDAFDDIWTSDQIQATRSATAWQAGQEKNFAARSIDDLLASSAAKTQADPESSPRYLEEWRKALPGFSGLVDAETLAMHQKKGDGAIVQAASRGLARQGRFGEAEDLIAKTAKQLDPAVVEDARNFIRAEQSRQEADLRKARILNANAMEIAFIDGKAGRQQINEGVRDGTIDPNDVPALIRSDRSERARREAEAKMDEASKAEHADWSLDALQMLSTSDALWRIDPEEWATAAPQAYELYQGMDRDRRRAVRQRHMDFLEKGESQDAAMGVYRDLVSRAKTLAPKDWKLTTETVFGEGDGMAFSGQLYGLAKRYAEESGGKAIPEKEAREIVSRALNAFKPYDAGGNWFGPAQPGGPKGVGGGYALPIDIEVQDMLNAARAPVDQALLAQVRAKLTARDGTPPDPTKLMNAYRQVQGQ